MPEHVDTAHKTLIGPRPHEFFAVHICSHQPTVKLEPLLGSLTISFSDHCRRAVIVVPARRFGISRVQQWAPPPPNIDREHRSINHKSPSGPRIEEDCMPKLNVNGTTRDIDAAPDTPLLWVIREQIGLTGTKYGCGIAQCAACSVHINGDLERCCSMPLSSVKPTDQIVTIAGRSLN